MRTLRIITFLAAISLLAGCEGISIQSDGSPAISGELATAIATFNRGSGLLEQYEYMQATEAFEEVLATAPDWTAARFNLGLAHFNMYDQPGEVDHLAISRQAFEEVLAAEPGNLHATFSLGLYYQHVGEFENAEVYFRKVLEDDPDDVYTMYKLAEVLISLKKKDESIAALEVVIERDPGFISAMYRLATQYQRAREPKKARPLFMRFKALKETELTGGTFTVLKSYGTSGKYYMALGADSLPLKQEAVKPKRVSFSPEIKTFDKKTNGGVAVADVDGDGDLDICFTGVTNIEYAEIYHNDGKGSFVKGQGFAMNVVSPCFGDVDEDGDADLWLGRSKNSSDMYFDNDGKGNFKATGLTTKDRILTEKDLGLTSCARLVDIDSDGDLDFMSFGPDRKNVVLNNNRDGSFTDIADKLGLAFDDVSIMTVIYDDFDNDHDLDLILFPKEGKPICWVNDRVWEYHILEADSVGLSVDNIYSATSGDPDKDGDRDLLVFAKEGLRLYENLGGFKFRSNEKFKQMNGSLKGTSGQFADMDNDGDIDIVIADAWRKDGSVGPVLLINDWPNDKFINAGDIDPGNLLSAIIVEGSAGCSVADFTGDGRCDILLVPAGQHPMLIENITPGGRWIEIDLIGTREQDVKSRSNNSAIGARVEIKAGSISQQYVVGVPTGAASVAPYRIHAGLGDHTNIDWLRIIWPDGVLQAELEIQADQVITINELQRKTSSCPHLFAWDGSRFAFIADFGGMGGVGYFLGESGQYAKPDSTEYLPVPNLKAKDGEFVLQVIEPLEEIVFFDEAKLLAVDHPVGTEVYPNEMMAINISPPEFELFCYRDTIDAVRAINHRGEDVTERLLSIDRKYAGTTELEGRFTGFADDHFIELDFDGQLNDITSDDRLVLFMYGWVEYGYSSTNFASVQAGMVMKAPSIEVQRNGKWVMLFDQVGYPAGINHMMTLDVTGKILPGDERIRISSNMELYWDRVFLAKTIDSSNVSTQQASVKTADLHFLGFPKEYSPDGAHPRLFDYDNIDRTVPWKTMTGSYTRYGDVEELVESADDRYVIMARGEEITLRFDAGVFGQVPSGYQRSFILKSDSYCKDMDSCSAYPLTVEPLPFHEMSNYPYPADEKYPDDQTHKDYQEKYNTRKLGGFNY